MGTKSDFAFSFLAGCAIGAAAVYFTDDRRGAARRAMVRQKAASGLRDAADTLEKRARDMAQRLKGRVYETQHKGEEVDDALLVDRVRAQIGKRVAMSSKVHVRCEAGRVVLEGQAQPEEINGLLEIIMKVRGVKSVENQLDAAPAEALPPQEATSPPLVS